MSRYSLLTLVLLLAGRAHAQTAPIIRATDMPAVGDTLRLSQAAIFLPASAPPLTRNGANQTWNYASLVPLGQRVTNHRAISTVTSPLLQLTFNSTLNPTTRATLVAPTNIQALTNLGVPVANLLTYYAATAADFRSVGFSLAVTGLDVPVTASQPAQQDVIYQFPLAYGNAPTVSNSAQSTPAILAGVLFYGQKQRRTNQVDAWGTLTTPYGTFQTLRVVTTLRGRDSVAVAGTLGVGSARVLTREYKWLATGIRVPVLSITTIEVAGFEVVAGVEYRDVPRRFRNGVALAAASATPVATLSLYPNPAQQATTLSGAAPATPVQVIDALGRVVATTTTSSTGTASLAWAADRPAGLYFVRAGQQVARLVVE
ncbi:MAG: T9SS type A sorting domain-containing protein [Hymenobacter sp.]|nr:MAG: T9SS type A sorting domain-containing protein [Hymenobacter sp.]